MLDTKAKNEVTDKEISDAEENVMSTIAILEYFKPRFYFIENPAGGLQHRAIMLPLRKQMNLTSYCAYGCLYKKDTCIWSNVSFTPPLKRCSIRSPCWMTALYGRHLLVAQQGSRPKGVSGNRLTPGMRSSEAVYPIPQTLLRDIFRPVAAAFLSDH